MAQTVGPGTRYLIDQAMRPRWRALVEVLSDGGTKGSRYQAFGQLESGIDESCRS
jgi:hypothetical protein